MEERTKGKGMDKKMYHEDDRRARNTRDPWPPTLECKAGCQCRSCKLAEHETRMLAVRFLSALRRATETRRVEQC